MTYRSEIWISDFNIKPDNIHVLPFEKVQNMMMKNILGVQTEFNNKNHRLSQFFTDKLFPN
jgi:hypothetical protein